MDQDTLFSSQNQDRPLAERMRPQEIEHIQGQRHFLNPRFQKMVDSDRWNGLIFWGPPGTGKTTLASTIAQMTRRTFHTLSAVTAGVKEIRAKLDESREVVRHGGSASIIFIDEVHRLNKAQQDVLLPYLECGDAKFIGATTENPSFEINNAIASRCLIFRFNPLSESELLEILKRSCQKLKLTPKADALEAIAARAQGDARRALTLLEHIRLGGEDTFTKEDVEEVSQSQSLYYDKKSESHYDTISAFIKSVRGSDPDASVYYLARMLEGGEDPMFVARRLIILAAEDVGNANPMALVLATQASEAVHRVGMPEARIILSQATLYLACSEKSNRSYQAIEEALGEVRESGPLEIPMHIRNAPTKLMKEWGYGKGYQYPHNSKSGWVKESYLPSKLGKRKFFQPTERGAEGRMRKFLEDKQGETNPSS